MLLKIATSSFSSIYFSVGITGLLPEKMKCTNYLLLFIYFFSLYYWIDTSIGQWLTLPLIAGGSMIIYLSCHKNMFDLILSLTGYVVMVLINHAFTIPLTLSGKSIPYMYAHWGIPFRLVLTASTLLILRLIRRFLILPKLSVLHSCPKKLQKFFLAELYLGISLLTANYIYGESASYPADVLSWNGAIISVFVLSTALIFYGMYDILEKNHELSLQQARSAVMQDYTQRMESLYEEVRIFRHDYRNILSTMQIYIDNGSTEELREYFHRHILQDPAVFSDNGFVLGRLHLIEDPAVKSLLYTKLIAILNRSISLTVEIADPVPVLPMDSLTLCRILGILLDNALEAADESEERTLHLSIVTTETDVTFLITNSTQPLSVPVSALFQRGYSSKENHDGIGLSSAAELLDAMPYANLSVRYEDNVFCQSLEILKNTMS